MSNATSAVAVTLAGQQPSRSAVVQIPSAEESDRLQAISQRIDVLADNLANAQTVGFKRRRADIGLGTKPNLGDLALDMTEGSLDATGGNLDVAITGAGFFQIKMSPNLGGGVGYARCGALSQNYQGDVVVGLGSGYELIPPINIPPGATNVSITTDGQIQYVQPGKTTTTIGGQIQLATFINPQSLGLAGGGVYIETAASGAPLIGDPGQNGTGELQQGFLEESNVDPFREWAAMLKAEQSLQLNSQALQVLNKARQMVAGLDR